MHPEGYHTRGSRSTSSPARHNTHGCQYVNMYVCNMHALIASVYIEHSSLFIFIYMLYKHIYIYIYVYWLLPVAFDRAIGTSTYIPSCEMAIEP